jgi:photosystem II stability/assembly factor-like uncharacterized protein
MIMKRIVHIIAGSLLLFALLLTGDKREKSTREIYRQFIKAEQLALKNISDKNSNPKLFTGVQYAALQNYYMTLDPEILRVPVERLPKAMEITNREKKDARLKSAAEFPMSWQQLDANMGGRTRALMWDPNDPEYKKVWAAGVTGGIWYREDIFDNNSRWKIVSDSWETLNIGCITYDPVNTQIFYAGTGEGQTARVIYRESGGRGTGILKSIDGGQNWSLLESTEDFAYITDIEVVEENGNGVIYAGVTSGEYQGRDIESMPGDGLYRSDDGGATWQQVLPNIPGKDYSYAVSDIEITSTGRIFVGTGISLKGDGAANILYSDDGLNWNLYSEYEIIIEAELIYNYPGRVVLASAHSEPNRVYAFLTAAGGEFYSFKSPWCRYIIRSDDGGESWSEVNMPEADGGWAYIAWHALGAVVNPENPDLLYAGGLDLHVSSDRGMSWTPFSLWYNFENQPGFPNYVHADQHIMKFRPGSATDVLFTTDGGVFLSTNAKDANIKVEEKNHGFNTLQYYTCAIHPAEGEHHFLAGAQDNGTVRYHERNIPVDIFDNVSYGDGTFCFIDEDNPDLQITTSQFNYLYINRKGFRNGESTFGLSTYQTGVFLNASDYDSKRNIFFTNDCDFYGNNADRLLRIWNLDKIPQASRINLNRNIEVPISAIEVSPCETNSSTLIIGTQDGRLFRVTNADYNIGGNTNAYTVSEITGSGFPVANIACVSYGQNEDQILVIFSNYGIPSVWETRDGGENWINKEQNLPDMPIRWAVYHPDNSNQVMLATESGLWQTNNFGDESFTWAPVENFPTVRVDMLQLRKSDYVMIAATHGRGLWYGSEYPLMREDNPVSEASLRLYPNPANQFMNIRIPEMQNQGNVQLRIYDMQGKLYYQSLEVIASGSPDINISLSALPEGNYILRLDGDGMSMNGKLMIER